MDHPDRAQAVFSFMTTVKWMLGVLFVIVLVTFFVIVGAVVDSRKQTIDIMEAISKRLGKVEMQADLSEKDRAELRETQGAIREMLKRTEAAK